MATTTTVHGQLIRYDANGDQTIINLKTAGTDVSIDRTQNTKLPTTVTNAQTLANALKGLAFKDSLSKSDVGLGSVDNTADANKSVKYATSAGYSSGLHLNPSTRQASADINMGSGSYNSRITYMLATSTMKTSKPPQDGHIFNLGWDTAAGWGAQFAVGNAKGNHAYIRGCSANSANNGSEWETWKTLLDSSNYSSYAAPKSHSHDYVPSNQFQSYVLSGASGAAKWQKLGVVTSPGDASNIIFDIYTGDGYNASARQNTWIRIMLKDGWQQTASATSACAATAWIFYPRESADAIDQLKIMIRATSSVDYGVYVYFPWTYFNGNFTVMGRFTKFVQDGTLLDSTPTVGTEQDVRIVKMITGDTVVDDDELLYVSKTAPTKACIWAKLD